MTTVRYLTAAQWGGVWARPPVAETMPDVETYVHHTGAPGVPWAQDDAIVEFRRLNSYAINSKGYSFLDYDVLVHYSRGQDVLTIGEGRGKWLSAATRDRNEEGEAVLLCGNFDLREPLAIELEGAALGIKYGIDNGWIARTTVIRGHRDNPEHPGATSCPGNALYAQLPAIRTRVAQLLNPEDDVTEEDIQRIVRAVWAERRTDNTDGTAQEMWAFLVETRSEAANAMRYAAEALNAVKALAASLPASGGGPSAAAIADELARRLQG